MTDDTPRWPDGIPADYVSNYEWPARAMVAWTKATRNSAMLIEYLRRGGAVTPELAAYLADLLDGKARAKPKPRKLEMSASAARELIDYHRELIENVSDSDHPRLMTALKRAGYKGDYPNDKSERTKAARHLAADLCGMTLSTLDEMAYPRKARDKST